MNGRDKNGRFKKGVSGNPNGRPPKEREKRYYELAMTTVTYKDWQDIIKRAAHDAKRGDASARKWLSEYLAPQAQLHKVAATLEHEVFEVSIDEDADSNN